MENMKELIKAIKNKMADLPSLTEENIKNHIVVNLFLKEMGYDPDKWDYECRISNGRADLVYKENCKPLLIVETKGLRMLEKNQSIDITDNDIDQISNYLNKQQDGIVWGILTNGKRYILLNGTIEGKLRNRIVFDISIENPTDQYYLKYFSYKTIFETKTTNFFADITRYRNWFQEESDNWKYYKGTLFNFFDYYSETHDYRAFGKNDRECLSKITVDDFICYIKENRQTKTSKNGRKAKSQETIKNNYTHISSFFKALKINHYIDYHDFDYSRNEFIKMFDETPKIKNENYLNVDRFSKALDYLYKKDKTGTRDLTIFLLCAYYGFDRSEVNELKWENIDFKQNKISIGKHEHEMFDLIKLLLEKIFNERRELKSNQEYVIIKVSRDTKKPKLSKVSTTTINFAFDCLRNIDNNDNAWILFSPHYVRQCLVQNMFSAGFSIEQTVAYTGIDIGSIKNYISQETIISEGKKRIKNGYAKVKHPYAKAVERFYNKITA